MVQIIGSAELHDSGAAILNALFTLVWFLNVSGQYLALRQ